MKNLFYLFGIVFVLASCGKKEQDGMTAHCKDPEFKKAHKIPGKLTFYAKGTMVDYPTPDGKTSKLYQVGEQANYDKYLFVIHEWWGLNDHIKQEAERLQEELGIGVFALDMYDGNVATTRDSASIYMQSVQEERANAIIQGALNLIDKDDKIATIGWCFGGGWSLNTAILAKEQTVACVIYYGMPTDDLDALGQLESDVLGIFATKDEWITPEVIESFEDNMNKAKKTFNGHWFEANHAFANPSSSRYHEESAQKANALALDYLKGKFK
ncbi:MAG: carboxymethylenebutenolidase [Maribacter sp.]|jgi:carboxymethylenebutenolidase